jgi:hypothetical protein
MQSNMCAGSRIAEQRAGSLRGSLRRATGTSAGGPDWSADDAALQNLPFLLIALEPASAKRNTVIALNFAN